MGRHVTAIDLPGHGGTAIDAPGLDALVDAVASFLAGLGGEPVELVGHSLGGAVAARVARAAPSRVRRVTLLAPAGLDRAIDVDFVRGIVRAQDGGLQHLLRRLVVRPAAMTPPQLEALAAELGRGRLHALADALVDDGGQIVDITGDLRALPMPVRVVWGVQDRIIPWTQVKEAGSRASITLIADAGHVPIGTSRPRWPRCSTDVPTGYQTNKREDAMTSQVFDPTRRRLLGGMGAAAAAMGGVQLAQFALGSTPAHAQSGARPVKLARGSAADVRAVRPAQLGRVPAMAQNYRVRQDLGGEPDGRPRATRAALVNPDRERHHRQVRRNPGNVWHADGSPTARWTTWRVPKFRSLAWTAAGKRPRSPTLPAITG